jgi:predicted transcriptional regulator of viral defense system
MELSGIIIYTINRLPYGYVFTYADFEVEVKQRYALNKALNRLVEAGKIRRLSKGRFYKPQITQFGELQPDMFQIVKDLVEKDGKTIGYITGYYAYNQLGLTTQVPASIQVATNNEKKALTRGLYRISFTKQANRITKENIPLFRILDAIRNIKEIPDTSVDSSCERLMTIIKGLSDSQVDSLKRLALKYNPATIALTGAIIESALPEKDVTIIFKALKPATTYKLNISKDILPNQSKWFIK